MDTGRHNKEELATGDVEKDGGEGGGGAGSGRERAGMRRVGGEVEGVGGDDRLQERGGRSKREGRKEEEAKKEED